MILERQQTKRGVARLELGAGALELRARKDGGVDARPQGIKASIEGVPVRGPTSLIHGMVVQVEEKDGRSKPFVYTDRPLNASEKKRAWIEPSDEGEIPLVASQDPEAKEDPKEKRRRSKRAFLSASKETISDIASVDEILVIDDSQDTSQPGWLMFGERQLVPLDAGGKLAGEPLYFKTNRLDADTVTFEVDGKRLVFKVDEETGAHLQPPGKGAKVAIAGVPLGDEGAALVHGMVFSVGAQSFLYLDREPKESERLRTFHEPVSKDSVSDVGSVDEIYVMDDSEDGSGSGSDSDVSQRPDLRIEDSAEG
jgi:hypothetical protein